MTLCGLGGLSTLGRPAPVSAQISPGPLARPHAQLEGSLQCVSCHGGGGPKGGKEAMTTQCLGCHKEIAWLIQQRRGPHAREVAQPCATCHPDHAGRDFALINWAEGDPSRFDHRRAGWPLEGSHRTLECAKCHKQELRVSPAAALFKRKSGTPGWVGLERECTSCHEDVHRGALDHDCTTCHNLEKWKPAPRFDHAKTDYPLTGKHAEVSCEKCHLDPHLGLKRTSAGDPIPVYRPLSHQECSTCHQDPHRGGLGPTCANCHTTAGFRTVARSAFDHDRTKYPLRGKHASLPCAKCHDFSTAKGRNPPFATCTACHADPHGGTATLAGRAVDCASCHDVQGFKPSTYTVARHREAKYPLAGRHQQVPCASCHVKNPPGVPASRLGRAGVLMRPAFARCRDCHAEDHGTQLRARADAGDCARCHAVGGWTPSTFKAAAHAKLKVTLEGRHGDISCAACHGSARKGLPPLPAGTVLGKAGVLISPRETECVSCHVDPHQGRFASGGARPQAEGCTACHGFRAFRPSTMDFAVHSHYALPLEGAHRAVPCVACHAEMKRPTLASSLRFAARPAGPALAYQTGKTSCESCHESPHGTQFAHRADRGACEGCHGTDGFRPASRFDHDRDATFSLAGAHAKVPCASCHVPRPGANGRSPVVYRPLSAKCESCHDDQRSRS
jgi:hypothetical protein